MGYNKENIHEFIYEILTEHVKSFLWLLLVEKDVIKDKFCEELFLYEDKVKELEEIILGAAEKVNDLEQKILS